ncbi:MAG: hypothetical protein HUK19_05235 [Fibrobacter sp.]|nr:hypothetical protein [Fibrobacter sp.]
MLDVELLTSAKVQDFIAMAHKRKMDALQVSTALNKAGFNNDERAAIMDYMALVPKFREKFFGATDGPNCDRFLLCDKLALEQSTAKDIGRWKSQLWPSDCNSTCNKVHDLCCGMGGDSFFIPSSLEVIGVDLDESRLAMYRYNNRIIRGEGAGKTLLADARTVNETSEGTCPADFFTIDPARRAVDGENQRDLRNLTPTFEEVCALAAHYKGGMAKLPPGYPTVEIPAKCELVYLGSHADCRECLVLFGDLAKNPGKVRAVMVGKDGETKALWWGDLDQIQAASNKDAEHDLPGCERSFRNATSESDLPVGELSQYLAEPTALLIRSHLFGNEALNSAPDAHLISEGIAYVTCESPLPSPAFANFKVIDHSEISTAAVRNMLKAHDIGKLTLKLRGVKLDPDAEIKRIKPKGKNSAVLFYTRFKGEKIAILAERI